MQDGLFRIKIPRSKLGLGVAFKEYPTDVGPADYGLLVNGQAIGILEAKQANQGHKITTVEEQSTGYADAKPKYNAKSEPLKFVLEATGEITRLTDRRDPKPRARRFTTFQDLKRSKNGLIRMKV